MTKKYDTIIIGAGVIGLSIARSLRQANKESKILIIEKEAEAAEHSSGRNSGVLHAGFYYSADSFKAKFTVEGNKAMVAYCKAKNIPINHCGKLVVAKDEAEHTTLYELEKRGRVNGSNVEIVDVARARELEPNVRTYKHALFSPDTATINPKQVCLALKRDLDAVGVDFSFNTCYLKHDGNTIETTRGCFAADKIINCAGLYADKIAQDFGLGQKYTMIPFKGLYLKYTKNKTDVKMNIYPVPNLKNPFLGVHFTITEDNTIKIGPTAIPALWRENYGGFKNFKWSELLSVGFYDAKLFITNAFGFRDLGFDEMRKYIKSYLVGLARDMVQDIDLKGFTETTRPGIRAQLLDTTTSKLVQDFVIEADEQSIHILNAVSPAFTCAFPFADFVRDHYVWKEKAGAQTAC